METKNRFFDEKGKIRHLPALESIQRCFYIDLERMKRKENVEMWLTDAEFILKNIKLFLTEAEKISSKYRSFYVIIEVQLRKISEDPNNLDVINSAIFDLLNFK